MIETEIKAKVDNLEDLRKKIYSLEGVYKFSLHHEDIYFNMPEGFRDFQRTDEALRIRSSKEYNNKIKDDLPKISHYMTYKGKKLDNLTKTREEIEVKIDDNKKMRGILFELGFKEILTVIKERELYEVKFAGVTIEILLDYIPILGSHYMELELMVESPEKIQEANEVLFKLMDILGFKKSDSIRKSYLELIIEQS